MLALVTGTFQACTSKKGTNNTDSTSTTTTTDVTKTAATDTSKLKPTADSADIKFANKAAVGGMAEVALGKLALQKTANGQIKDFANMMVNDHGKANDELMSIAKTKNIVLPATVDAEHQQKMDDLSKKTGSEFDKAYVNAMVDGHKSTLSLMQDEAKNGKDADLKKFADKTSTVVQMHLDHITKIHDGMKQ
ncbi:MAG: Membrane protein [Mucilaginibacter sp.]|nr:Membrane protein [Mucilaginibacter sp.]